MSQHHEPEQRPAWPDPAGLPPDDLYRLGVETFNARDFYEAHDFWEELWTEHQLPDRKFVQGLIQLAVGCFHLTNDNVNGGRGLFGKCLSKFDGASVDERGLDVAAILRFVQGAQLQLETLTVAGEFDWQHLPTLAMPNQKD